MRQIKQKKKDNRIFPIFLIGSTILIIAIMLLSILPDEKNEMKNKTSINTGSTGKKDKEQSKESTFTAVVKAVDELTKDITLTNISDGQDYIMDYTGGTNFMNKYGKVTVVSSISIGEIVDATYNLDTGKLTKVQVSDKVFSYEGISNWRKGSETNSLVIAENKYRYVDYVVVSNKGKNLSLEDLDETDEIIVKGLDREIYSIIVTKGHGSLKFKGYEDFLGGIAYIGTRYIMPIVEDMVITVREGDYEITFEEGNFTGSVSATAIEGEEVLVDFSEFKKPVVEKGSVTFSITPEGADLYIDNELVEYDEAVTLDYGKHDIIVSLGGYTTYNGKLEVKESEQTVTIALVESKINTDKKEATNTQTQNKSQTNTQNNTGTSKDNNNGSYSEVKSGNYIHVEGPEGASVYFNGEFKGTAPVSFPKKAGTQYITLIKSGYQTKTYTISVEDDMKDVTLDFPELEVQD